MYDSTIKPVFVIADENGMFTPKAYKAVCFVSRLSDAAYYWDKASATRAMETVRNPLKKVLHVVEAKYNTTNGVVF